jgi:hypothetical protein
LIGSNSGKPGATKKKKKKKKRQLIGNPKIDNTTPENKIDT